MAIVRDGFEEAGRNGPRDRAGRRAGGLERDLRAERTLARVAEVDVPSGIETEEDADLWRRAGREGSVIGHEKELGARVSVVERGLGVRALGDVERARDVRAERDGGDRRDELKRSGRGGRAHDLPSMEPPPAGAHPERARATVNERARSLVARV